MNPATPEHLFDTGARRSVDADTTRYDLISPIALEAIAATCHEGAVKYGDMNWERGMPVHDLLNHALRHIFRYLAGDRSEPHLPHAGWGLMAAIHSEALWPHLNDENLRSEGCTLGPAMLAKLARQDAERVSRRLAPPAVIPFAEPRPSDTVVADEPAVPCPACKTTVGCLLEGCSAFARKAG